MLFDIKQLFFKISTPEDIETLSRQELETFIDASPGSPTAPALPHLNQDTFKIEFDPEDMEVDPIFAYIKICRIQKQLLDRVWATTTQCGANLDTTPHPSNVNQMPHIMKAIDHCMYLTAKIRPRLIHAVEKRLLDTDYPLPHALKLDYWGIPQDMQPDQLHEVKDQLMLLLTVGSDEPYAGSLAKNAKPPIGVVPGSVDDRERTTEWYNERITKLCKAIEDYAIRGLELPIDENGAYETWLDELEDNVAEMHNRKRDARKTAVERLDHIDGLFPNLLTEEDKRVIQAHRND